MPFPVEVVTPERALVSEPVTTVVLRTSDGEMTVLDGHTSLVAVVEPGEVRVEREEGDPLRLAVHGGFLRVDTSPGAAEAGGAEPGADEPAPTAGSTDHPLAGLSTRVTLLTGIAELAGEIDVDRAQRARDQAEARVSELRASGGRSAGGPAPARGEGTEAAASEGAVAGTELAEAEGALARAELRLEVAAGS